MTELNILSQEDYKPTTITARDSFNTSIDVSNVAKYLPIYHIYNDDGSRFLIKQNEKKKKKIPFKGLDKQIVSICYNNIKRGIRQGKSMDNMLSLDIQIINKNIHIKISSDSILALGARSLDEAIIANNTIIAYIKETQKSLDYISSFDNDNIQRHICFLKKTIEDNKYNKRKIFKYFSNDILNIDKELINIFLLYLEDYDIKDYEQYYNKLKEMKEKITICKDNLKTTGDYVIYNAVYYNELLEGHLIPLHHLAPFLGKYGIMVEYDNRNSTGLTACFNVEEEKNNLNGDNKTYKHRFTVMLSGKIKQVSACTVEESYKYYKGFSNLLKKFYERDDLNFEEYMISI